MKMQNNLKNGNIEMIDCLIFAGSELNISNFEKSKYSNAFVICADRGLLHAQALGIKPNLAVGDFDSLKYSPQECETLRFPTEKDDTDLLIAVKEAIKRGFKNIDILGALGGRVDHMYGNIQVLSYACDNNANAHLISDDDIVSVYSPGTYAIPKLEGYSLSLFSYSTSVENICISGTLYQLNNGIINNSFPIGISNVIVDDNALISFSDGKLLVIQSKL